MWAEDRMFLCSDEVLREHAADEDATGKDVFRPGGDVQDQLPHHMRRWNDGHQSSYVLLHLWALANSRAIFGKSVTGPRCSLCVCLSVVITY